MAVSIDHPATEQRRGLQTLDRLTDEFRSYGRKPALVAFRRDAVEEWSYAELADRVDRLASGLQAAGIDRGDPVGLWAEAGPELVAASLAALRAGGVAVPIDAQMVGKDLNGVFADGGVRLVFTTRRKADWLQEGGIEADLQPILLDVDRDDERSWERLLSDETAERPERNLDDTAVLFYTSGTTGPPKGVPLTHENIAFQLKVLRDANLVHDDDRILLPLPLHHVYPFVVGMLTPLTLGLPIVFPRSLTGPQIVRAIKEGEVSVLVGVPRLFAALWQGIQTQAKSRGWIAAALFAAATGASTWLARRIGLRPGRRLFRRLHEEFGPRLRLLASGGSPLDPELAWKLEGLGWQVGIGYGLTETSPLLTLMPPGDPHLDSVGRPVPGIEVRVDPSARPDTAEEQTSEPAAAETGEIQARGPSVFSGYRHLPDKTDEAFADGGWFRTGDLGFFDRDGYLHVLGRVSTLIVTEGGENVQPDQVEDAYAEQPSIREVGVLQHKNGLVGLIVPDVNAIRRDGADVEPAVRSAVESASRNLPTYKRLSDYAVTSDPLPRTRLGKLRRHLLRELYEQAKTRGERPETETGPLPLEKMSSEDRALLEHEAPRQVWKWLADTFPDRRLAPETNLEVDLGIDSLEWLNLTLEIRQRAGVELDQEAIERIEAVRDLLQEVQDAGESGRTGEAELLDDPEAALSEDERRWLQPLGRLSRTAAGCGFALNRGTMRTVFRVRSTGLENLPRDGPFVIAPNHVSYLDPFVIAATLEPRRLRDTYWAAWRGTAFRNAFVRAVSRLSQAVPIDLRRGAITSLALAAAVLKRGKNLVWFPEGERSPTGELQPFKPGLGLLLARYDVPVVPVFIDGTYQALPRGRFLPKLRKVQVSYGQPATPGELEQLGAGEEPHERIVRGLRERIRQLGARDTR